MIRADAISYSYNNGWCCSGWRSPQAGRSDCRHWPNGSGKTTLLRLMSGALAPRDGRVLLDGTVLQRLPHRELALQIAVVPQEVDLPFPFTVRQLVELGRTPHRETGWLASLSSHDDQVVETACSPPAS